MNRKEKRKISLVVISRKSMPTDICIRDKRFLGLLSYLTMYKNSSNSLSFKAKSMKNKHYMAINHYSGI